VDVAPIIALLEQAEPDTDLRPALAFLAGRELELEPALLNAARRRALFLLAAGGDPQRGLALDGRAVPAFAAELERAEYTAGLARALEALEKSAAGLPRVTAALAELRSDGELAWRAYACALLAEEVEQG
jgi:hypothetical protein